jgi:hypothetical protein
MKLVYVFNFLINTFLYCFSTGTENLGIFYLYVICFWQTCDRLPDAIMRPNMNGSARVSVLGGFSFEADSLADFSEFDSTSVVLEYQAER